MRVISKNLKETKSFTKKVVKRLLSNKQTPSLVCLSGHLGAGKTTLVKIVAKTLGIKENVTSPTFVIMKFYPLDSAKFGFKRMVHIDAYRLQGGKELLTLGFEEIINNKENLIFLEWPENVKEVLSEESVKIHLKVLDENQRVIDIKWPKKQKTKNTTIKQKK